MSEVVKRRRGIDESGIQGSTIPIPLKHGGANHRNFGVGERTSFRPKQKKKKKKTQNLQYTNTMITSIGLGSTILHTVFGLPSLFG